MSVCTVQTQIFENFDLETSILVCRYIFRISRSLAYIKVNETRSRSQQQRMSNERNIVHTFAVGRPLVERHSCGDYGSILFKTVN